MTIKLMKLPKTFAYPFRKEAKEMVFLISEIGLSI